MHTQLTPQGMSPTSVGRIEDLIGKKWVYFLSSITKRFTSVYQQFKLDGFQRIRGENDMQEGNVVLGYTTDTHLMLDCDLKREGEVIHFSRKYAKSQDLGDSAVFKTSDANKTDFQGHRLGNYCIIFGRITSWEENEWHLKEACRVGIVDKNYVDIMIQSGYMTIRVNAQNSKIPFPTLIDYFHNGDSTGIAAFMKHWKMCRNMGK